jgi:hypothetical protein
MGEAVTHSHHPTGGPAPPDASFTSPDPRELWITSPDGRIVPLLPSVPSADQQLRSELEILRSNYDQVSRYSERADRTIAQQAARIAELESMLGPEAVQIHGKYRIVLAELQRERDRSRRLSDALSEISEAIGGLHPGDLVEPGREVSP